MQAAIGALPGKRTYGLILPSYAFEPLALALLDGRQTAPAWDKPPIEQNASGSSETLGRFLHEPQWRRDMKLCVFFGFPQYFRLKGGIGVTDADIVGIP